MDNLAGLEMKRNEKGLYVASLPVLVAGATATAPTFESAIDEVIKRRDLMVALSRGWEKEMSFEGVI